MTDISAIILALLAPGGLIATLVLLRGQKRTRGGNDAILDTLNGQVGGVGDAIRKLDDRVARVEALCLALATGDAEHRWRR